MSNALQRVTGLRAVRLAHRLTQQQLATMAGVGALHICRTERRYPSVWRRLVRICDALAVSADEILGRAPVTVPVDALARADRELLDAMRADAIELFGEQMIERCGGWRRIARSAWLGHLIGARDRLLRLPPADSAAPPSVEPQPEPYTRLYPVSYFQGWESPRVRARRLGRRNPQRVTAPKRRALPKGATRAEKLEQGVTP
jgi:transcriptional regulator with XRE-family HTH domain